MLFHIVHFFYSLTTVHVVLMLKTNKALVNNIRRTPLKSYLWNSRSSSVVVIAIIYYNSSELFDISLDSLPHIPMSHKKHTKL